MLSGSIFATQARVWTKYKKVAMGHYGQHLGMVSGIGISKSIANSSKAGPSVCVEIISGLHGSLGHLR
eukprot:COSAG02_NODE_521_length_20750_cov_10.721079_16_plen_68_part_00